MQRGEVWWCNLDPTASSRLLRKEFRDAAFESRQDVLAGELGVFAEQSAFRGFAVDGGRAGFRVDQPNHADTASEVLANLLLNPLRSFVGRQHFATQIRRDFGINFDLGIQR